MAKQSTSVSVYIHPAWFIVIAFIVFVCVKSCMNPTPTASSLGEPACVKNTLTETYEPTCPEHYEANCTLSVGR